MESEGNFPPVDIFICTYDEPLDILERSILTALALDYPDFRNIDRLDWPQYSKGRYGAAQRDAERAGRGIWKGSYVEPWLYRARIRANGKPSGCSDDANAHP